MKKIEDREYPDYNLKNCDKENIVIKTKNDKIDMKNNKEIKLK